MSDLQALTVPQVAARLQVTEETVRRLIRQGHIAAWKIGGRAGYRVFESALTDFIERRAADLRITTIPACQDCGVRHEPHDKAACIEGHGDDRYPDLRDLRRKHPLPEVE